MAKRFSILILLALIGTFLIPQLASATKSEDKKMTKQVLSQADEYAEGFEDLAEAWEDAAKDSPEAQTLAEKGKVVYSQLEQYVTTQLDIFEQRRAWYKSKGSSYATGRKFMEKKIKKLKGMLEEAQELDLYQQFAQ